MVNTRNDHPCLLLFKLFFPDPDCLTSMCGCQQYVVGTARDWELIEAVNNRRAGYKEPIIVVLECRFLSALKFPLVLRTTVNDPRFACAPCLQIYGHQNQWKESMVEGCSSPHKDSVKNLDDLIKHRRLILYT
jgi:hypothetical protein